MVPNTNAGTHPTVRVLDQEGRIGKETLCVRFLSIIPANLWKTGKQEIASESSTTILEIVREEEGKKGKKREETGVDMVRDDETHGV